VDKTYIFINPKQNNEEQGMRKQGKLKGEIKLVESHALIYRQFSCGDNLV